MCWCIFICAFVIVYLKCTKEMMTVSLQEGGRSISLHNGHSRQPFLELNWISRSQQNSWRPDFFIYRWLFVQLDLLIRLFDIWWFAEKYWSLLCNAAEIKIVCSALISIQSRLIKEVLELQWLHNCVQCSRNTCLQCLHNVIKYFFSLDDFMVASYLWCY